MLAEACHSNNFANENLTMYAFNNQYNLAKNIEL